jgi:hypothetical protein
MQSLVGTLNFACTVVQPGRAFLRRMINLTCTVAEHQKFFSISEEEKSIIGVGKQSFLLIKEHLFVDINQ